ncbi:DivIVA domain-containing protein [Microbacterium sp. NPDC076911]|uniref:DivIVA domain-containing protein n=1 Tax=Microbacterium sp. NPDC076911 TaxID=3154958 RepID=UPI00343454F2
MTAVETKESAFPITRGRTKGYSPAEVDAFISRARVAFEEGEEPVGASDIRQAAFPLVRRGYSIAAVDAALGRIEDAFAAREREAAVARGGVSEWVGQTRETAQVVLDRLSRPRRSRFARVSALRYGYRVEEVDLVADKLSTYLQTGESVTVEQVRGVAFRMQRGGYREVQVDAVLDAVVEVMLAVE